MCFILINEKEESFKVCSIVFFTINQGMWRSFLSSLSLLKRGKGRRGGGVKGESKRYLPLSMLLLL
jgi:hypothetical protein